MEFLKELAKKIELQSVLVLAVTLIVGFLLLNKDNSVHTPAGLLGSICIGFGILYTIISFFSNQIRESYKDVIAEYKSHIGTLKSSHTAIEKSFSKVNELQTNLLSGKRVGEYTSIDVHEDETKVG